MRRIIWLCQVAWLGLFIRGEMFTSLVGLEKLLSKESHIHDKLHEYIRREEDRLEQLRKVPFPASFSLPGREEMSAIGVRW